MRIASICLLLYWLAIFVGTHLPGASLPKMHLSDKLLHLGAYTGLAFLLAWAIPTRAGQHLYHALITFVIVLLYGCLDELTQNFIPGRTSSLADLAADALGAALGITLYFACRTLLLQFSAGKRLIQRLSR